MEVLIAIVVALMGMVAVTLLSDFVEKHLHTRAERKKTA